MGSILFYFRSNVICKKCKILCSFVNWFSLQANFLLNCPHRSRMSSHVHEGSCKSPGCLVRAWHQVLNEPKHMASDKFFKKFYKNFILFSFKMCLFWLFSFNFYPKQTQAVGQVLNEELRLLGLESLFGPGSGRGTQRRIRLVGQRFVGAWCWAWSQREDAFLDKRVALCLVVAVEVKGEGAWLENRFVWTCWWRWSAKEKTSSWSTGVCLGLVEAVWVKGEDAWWPRGLLRPGWPNRLQLLVASFVWVAKHQGCEQERAKGVLVGFVVVGKDKGNGQVLGKVGLVELCGGKGQK